MDDLSAGVGQHLDRMKIGMMDTARQWELHIALAEHRVCSLTVLAGLVHTLAARSADETLLTPRRPEGPPLGTELMDSGIEPWVVAIVRAPPSRLLPRR